MRLIVGLGNPGKEYESTRHNVGFLCVNRYLEAHNLEAKLDKKFKGLVATLTKDDKVFFLLPQTYMNLSGEAVYVIQNYYKIKLEDILVIYDDMDLPLGQIRLREKGSAGGHNGMKNIIMHLASLEVKRLRLGISSNGQIEKKDYVLSHFSSEEMKELDKSFEEVSDIIDEFISGKSFQKIMADHNKKKNEGDKGDC